MNVLDVIIGLQTRNYLVTDALASKNKKVKHKENV